MREIAEIIAARKEKEEYREMYRFAFLASVIANAFSKRGKTFRPEDFIGSPPKEEMSKDDIEFHLIKFQVEAKEKGLRTPPLKVMGNASR